MSEKERPFNVSDRRHFTPEGHSREDAVLEERPADAPPSVAQAKPGEPARADGSPEAATPADVAVDLAAFLLSLGAQASLLLGSPEAADSPAEALAGARQIISILEMLKDKTEGRRTDTESQVLESLLFQLRLSYVERAKQP